MTALIHERGVKIQVCKDLYYDDVEVGDDIASIVRTVTTEEVKTFLNVHPSRESGPSRFTSNDIAKEEGLANAIVPGGMNIAMMSTLVTGWSDTVRLKKLDVVFRGMVSHNQELTFSGIVTDKYVVDGEALLECDVFLENKEGTKLIIGNALFALPSV